MNRSSYCLFLDTSTERAVVAIGTLDSTPQITYSEELPFGLQSSKFLVPRIEAAFAEVGIAASDLAAVAVGQGPGSYTGVRVGVSVARAFAYAQKLPLIAVPTLCGFASDVDGPFAAVIDAKISGLYLLVGRREGGAVTWRGEPEVVAIEALGSKLDGIETLVTPQAARIGPRVEVVLGRKFRWEERAPSLPQCFVEAERRYRNGDYATDATCEILYLRKTQAEIERQGESG